MPAASATAPVAMPTPGARAALPAAGAIARRAFADGRIRTISFAWLFAFAGYANVVGYRSAYPALKDRIALAHSLGTNDAVRLFYGKPYDLLTVGGYAAWRIGGVMTLFAAVWGLLAAVRALRAEEDAGRAELVQAGIVSRRGVYLSALAAVVAGAAILWLATFLGLVAARRGLSGAGDRRCRAGVRGRRCAGQPARAIAARRDRALQRGAGALLFGARRR
jgi:polyether ionophore transport system permease protein